MALSQWMSSCLGNKALSFVGPSALAIYRALGEKRTLARRELRSDLGYSTSDELGICGAFGYIYRQDARPEYKLLLMCLSVRRRSNFSRLPSRRKTRPQARSSFHGSATWTDVTWARRFERRAALRIVRKSSVASLTGRADSSGPAGPSFAPAQKDTPRHNVASGQQYDRRGACRKAG